MAEKVKDHLYTKIMKAYRRINFFVPFFNPLIRLILKLRFLFYNTDIKAYCQGKDEKINQWYQNHKIFFGLAIIRSGTTFLSDFLSQKSKEAKIYHEAIVDDYWSYANNYNNFEGQLDYIKNFRRDEIFYRLRNNPKFKTYGEINPFLRRHAKALKQIFPEAKFFHLVRDGRSVVRSIMCRATFDKKEPIKDMIKPDKNSPYYKKWDKMSRFEKVCWLWQEDNKYLRENIGYSIKFEKLISDYNYFKEKLLDYIGLEVSQEDWQQFINQPRNPSDKYSFPKYENWTEEQKQQFWSICGEEMELNGYSRLI